MNAYMGMRITEWEDGQVNIGIAVCPTTRKSAPVIGCYWTRDTQLSNPNNDGEYILPKSAFIMRPATSHRHDKSKGGGDAGFNITYAHQPETGSSDLGIMLTSTSSAIQDQDREGLGEGQSPSSFVSSTVPGQDIVTGMKVPEPEVSDGLLDSETGELELQEVKRSLEKEDESLGKSEKEAGEVLWEKGNSLAMPQSTKEIPTEVNSDVGSEKGKGVAASSEEKAVLRKPGAPTQTSGMKRVSWVEDIEKFAEEKASRNNSKENKRESVRKSNGKSSHRSPTKKQQQQQHGFNPDEREGYKTGKRNSGDKSRIPVNASGGSGGGGDYLPTSCDFYRRQMLRECCLQEDNYTPPTLADNWYGYTSLQKYAGQKVVKKFAAEQKRLEEDLSNRRKTEIWILGSDLDDFVIASPTVPIRKKTTRRLQPIQIQP